MEINPDLCGTSNAVAILGAFEHFCSPDEFRSGKQEQSYRSFFANVTSVLPARVRLFLQMMVLGRNVPPRIEFNLHAERDSDEYALALMSWGNPDSWLLSSLDLVIECAAPHFRRLETYNGRVDYIETLKRWSRRFCHFELLKHLLYGLMVPILLLTARCASTSTRYASIRIVSASSGYSWSITAPYSRKCRRGTICR